MKKNKRANLPHFGQIITTKETIIDFIRDNYSPVTENTVWLFAKGIDSPENRIRLYSVCARLYFLSKLVYRGKHGIRKLRKKSYMERLFDPLAETKEEIFRLLEHWNRKNPEDPVQCSIETTGQVYQKMEILKDLWCTFLSCTNEQAYIPEYAYAFEYAFKHGEILKMPKYPGKWCLFPQNYRNFDYTEGIARYFDTLIAGIF